MWQRATPRKGKRESLANRQLLPDSPFGVWLHVRSSRTRGLLCSFPMTARAVAYSMRWSGPPSAKAVWRAEQRGLPAPSASDPSLSPLDGLQSPRSPHSPAGKRIPLLPSTLVE